MKAGSIPAGSTIIILVIFYSYDKDLTRFPVFQNKFTWTKQPYL